MPHIHHELQDLKTHLVIPDCQNELVQVLPYRFAPQWPMAPHHMQHDLILLRPQGYKNNRDLNRHFPQAYKYPVNLNPPFF